MIKHIKMNILFKYFVILFIFGLLLSSCSKQDNQSNIKTDTNKLTLDSLKNDSSKVYGSGYYDYKDSIESFHMGYNVARDSIYKQNNIKAFENLNLLIQKNPSTPGPYLDRGNHFQNIQKYHEAIGDYNSYIALNPKNYSAYQNRGTAYERIKEYDKALADYSKVIELKPDDTIAHFNKGVVYDATNVFQMAIKEYDSTIMKDPKLAKAYYNRGVTYEKIGEFKKAADDFKKALQLNPQYGEPVKKRIEKLRKR